MRLKILLWIAALMPNALLYVAYVYVLSYATSGKYGSTDPHEIPPLAALRRFGNDHNIKL